MVRGPTITISVICFAVLPLIIDRLADNKDQVR